MEMTRAEERVLAEIIRFCEQRPGEWFQEEAVFPDRNTFGNADRQTTRRLYDKGLLSGPRGMETYQDERGCKFFRKQPTQKGK
jgi:hypothetical protein